MFGHDLAGLTFAEHLRVEDYVLRGDMCSELDCCARPKPKVMEELIRKEKHRRCEWLDAVNWYQPTLSPLVFGEEPPDGNSMGVEMMEPTDIPSVRQWNEFLERAGLHFRVVE